MRRVGFPLLLVATTIASLACTEGSNQRTASGADAGHPAEAGSGEPIACRTDADCPALSCGPCTPGEIVTRSRATMHCEQNPCVDGGSVCGPEAVCVVRPGAKKNPSVWCRACVDLRSKAASICAGKSTPDAKVACERSIEAAVESCDDAACRAARAAPSG